MKVSFAVLSHESRYKTKYTKFIVLTAQKITKCGDHIFFFKKPSTIFYFASQLKFLTQVKLSHSCLEGHKVTLNRILA